MGNTCSANLPLAIAEQMETDGTIVPTHDWFQQTIVLPPKLYVEKIEDTYNLPHWQLNTELSCETYDVYEDAGWDFYKNHRSDFPHKNWVYVTRVAVPKGKYPSRKVLSRGRELRNNSMSYRY